MSDEIGGLDEEVVASECCISSFDDDAIWNMLSELKGLMNEPDDEKNKNGEAGGGGGGCGNSSSDTDTHCCEKPNIINDAGQYVCKSCSTIASSHLDTGAEWRFYGADDSKTADPNRVGMPVNDLLPTSSLGSVIGNCRGDSRDVRRMRMYQIWNSMPYWERTLYNIFDQFNYKTANHGIPSRVLDEAKVLYKRLSEKRVSRGENKEGIIASCIYHACMTNGTPRSTKEIAEMFSIQQNVLTKGNARFQNLLKMNVKCSSSDDFIARFASRLNLAYDDILQLKLLAKKLDQLDVVSENSPTSIAAGAINMYVQLKGLQITKTQIAKECSVSEVTITKAHKRMAKWHDYIFDKDLNILA
jgi:transcription initiation factor TFIIB